MKFVILLAIIGFVAVQQSEGNMMSTFACADCYSYDAGPFCISNGSVVCNNCIRDKMMCQDRSLDSNACSSACDPNTGLSDPY